MSSAAAPTESIFKPPPHPTTKSLVQSPQPEWKLGENQPAPEGSYVELDPATMTGGQRYKFAISSVVPRPIALVSSVSAAGVVNLSPFSYFNVICHNPMTLMVSVNWREAGKIKKDTHVNAEETKGFVVNIMSEWFVESANYSCGNFAGDVDELDLVGLTAVPSTTVKAPRVKESACQFECTLADTYDLKDDEGTTTATILYGRVRKIWAHDQVYDAEKGTMLLEKLKPVSRCGDITYASTSHHYKIARPAGAFPVTPVEGGEGAAALPKKA